jgi:hypothetical protein
MLFDREYSEEQDAEIAKEEKRKKRVVAVIALIGSTALAILIIGGLTKQLLTDRERERDFKESAVRAEATLESVVEERRKSRTERVNVRYKVSYRFYVNSLPYSGAGFIGTKPEGYTLPVLYHPQNPRWNVPEGTSNFSGFIHTVLLLIILAASVIYLVILVVAVKNIL